MAKITIELEDAGYWKDEGERIFEEYHPTAKQLAQHFGAQYSEDEGGFTIALPFDTSADDQEEIVSWAQYEQVDYFYIEDQLVLSTRPTGPAGYHDPKGTGKYEPLP